MKICILLGCATFKIGVFPVSYGGDIVFQPGMTTKATFMLGVMKTKCAVTTTLVTHRCAKMTTF